MNKTYGKVRADRVEVDPSVQRELVRTKAKNIADHFNPEALGTICLSHRTDGTDFVIDGQTRIAALLLLGKGDFKVDAEIFTGLTLPEEAAMFRLRNNRTSISAVDRFRVRVVEGDELAMDINRILTAYGWKVSYNANPEKARGTIRCVDILERLYIASFLKDVTEPNIVEATINVATKAWGHDSNGVVGPITYGLGNLLLHYGDQVNIHDLVDRLAKYEGGPAKLWGAAKGFRATVKVRAQDAVSETIVRLYNFNRRSENKLENWPN